VLLVVSFGLGNQRLGGRAAGRHALRAGHPQRPSARGTVVRSPESRRVHVPSAEPTDDDDDDLTPAVSAVDGRRDADVDRSALADHPAALLDVLALAPKTSPPPR